MNVTRKRQKYLESLGVIELADIHKAQVAKIQIERNPMIRASLSSYLQQVRAVIESKTYA